MRSAMSRTDVGVAVVVQRQRQQRPARVVAPCRDLHRGIVGRRTPATGPEPSRGLPRLTAGPTDGRGSVAAGQPCGSEPRRATSPCSRTTRARASPTSSRRCSTVPTSRRPGSRPAPSTPTRSCCSCSTASAGTSSRTRRSPRADAGRHGRRSITTVAPSTTATALTSIATGLPPGRARRHGLPDGGRPRGAQRAAVDARPRRRPPAHPARARSRRPRPFASAAAAHRDRGRVRHVGLQRRPPRRRALRRLPRAVDDGHRGAPACSAPASRSSTPTTTASTRSPTSTASASTTTPSWWPSTASWSDLLDVLPPRRGARDHRRSRPGRRAATRCIDPHPDVHGARDVPVGRGPVPVAARPSRALPTRCSSAAQRPPPRRGLGASRAGDRRRGLVRADASADGARSASATSRSCREPVAFHEPSRHRPVRADRSPRVAHRGRDVSCPCS